MTNYDNLLAGAKGLLGDCVNILSTINPSYAIVGGWSPVILNSGLIKHPGTHDVDLLFSEGKNQSELKDIFNLFLANGYKTSAKHNFQLLKIISVAGKEFVYNVDFLHASDTQENADMFVDHLKLPVPLNEYCDDTYMEMSRVSPNSEVLFRENLYETIEQDFLLPDETSKRIRFPLINEAGLIITKTDSVKQAKRKRDSFDIYLAIRQSRNYLKLVDIFRGIKRSNSLLFNTLYGIREAIAKYGMAENICEFAFSSYDERMREMPKVKRELEVFLLDVGLEPLAKSTYFKKSIGK